MPRTTPRAHRASRTHTASRGYDARRRGFLALFSLLLCSSPRFALGELGAEGHDLSNFQGKHACGAKLRMSVPETVADVARVVAAFPKVRAVGVGHSWNTQLFCAGDASDAADVVLSKVRAVGRSVTGEPRSDHSANAEPSGLDHSRSLLGGSSALIGGSSDRRDSRFVADVAAMEASADAGATVRELLDFLRDFSPGESDDVGDVGDSSASPSKSALDVFRRLRRSTARGFDDDGDENTLNPGYTLAAFPWFVDQTVGGAAATATHGSSLRHGSLSSQVVAVTVVLANGTVAEFRESETPKHVFDAARASLGRLGATVRVTLKIKKNHPVRKTSRRTSPEAFASSVAKASDAFAACVDALDVTLDEDAYREKRKACALSSPHLRRLDETQAFWFFPLGTLTEVTFARLDDLEDDVRSREGETFDTEDETSGNTHRVARHESRGVRGAPLFVVPPADVSVAASVVAATRAPHANSVAALERRGVVRDQPRDAPRDVTTVRPALANDTFARFWSRQWERSTLENVASGVFPARDSYLTMTEAQYDAHDHFAYDQYEVCVPMRRAGACLRALARGARDGATGDVGGDAFGFRSQALIRFINEEDALLSPANGRAAGACMYVNIEDFVKYNLGGTNASSTETTTSTFSTTEKDEPSQKTQKNEPFLRVVRLLRSETCRGRLHWGKAGWLESLTTHHASSNDRNGNGTCFDGPTEYGESWCAFTCAAFRYDPGDKFVPAGSVFDPDRNAKFNREACCGAGGEYLREEPGCACAARAEPGGSCGAAWY